LEGISQSNESIEQISVTLDKMNETLFKLYFLQEKSHIEDKLSSLRSKVGKLQSALKTIEIANANDHSFVKFVGVVSKFASAAGGFYGALDVLNDTEEQLSSLRYIIKDVQSTLSQFLNESNIKKSEIASSLAAAFQRLNEAKSRYAYMSRERLTLIEDLIKVSLMQYNQDPARRVVDLVDNLEGLKILLLKYPLQEPTLSFSSPQSDCDIYLRKSTISRKCLLVSRFSKSMKIMGNMDFGSRRVPLELYKIEKGRGDLVIDLHGVPRSAINIIVEGKK
jgi:archaellum component FlaC